MTSSPAPQHGGRIDFHHHFLPSPPGSDGSEMAAAAFEQTGWILPPANIPWTADVSIAAMDRLGVEKAIFSTPLGGNVSDAASRKLARVMNDTAHSLVEEHPDRFAFFATVGIPLDPAAAIDEVAYAIDELGAVGVGLTTSYGTGEDAQYLGADIFDPLWEELDRRGTFVFIHGDQIRNSNRWPNKYLPIPVTEVPNETYKAAADLVTTGKKQALKNVKMLLSHSGGSTPFLASRVAGLSSYLGSNLSPEEIIESFQSFYYETALSGFRTNLAALESFVPDDLILFGTDFPAIPVETAGWYTDNVTHYFESDPARHQAIVRDNALALLPGLL